MSVATATACVHCGKSLEGRADERTFKGTSGTRLASDVWRAHLEADEFCSTECCRAHHDTVLPEPVLGRCADCKAPFASGRNTSAGPYCQECSRKERTRRYFFSDDVCSHCGIDKDEFTSGCWTCGARRRRRVKRAAAKSGTRSPAIQAARVSDEIPGATKSTARIAA